MTKRFRVHDWVKFNYSEIGEYIGEGYTDKPLRNDEIVDLLNSLNEENEQLKQQLDDYIFAHRTEMAQHRVVEKELKEKNQQLKMQLSNISAQRFTVEEMQNWDKRFKISKEDVTRVIDTFDEGEFWTVHGNEAYNLCILLNNLHKENQRLKQSASKMMKYFERAKFARKKEEYEGYKELLELLE